MRSNNRKNTQISLKTVKIVLFPIHASNYTTKSIKPIQKWKMARSQEATNIEITCYTRGIHIKRSKNSNLSRQVPNLSQTGEKRENGSKDTNDVTDIIFKKPQPSWDQLRLMIVLLEISAKRQLVPGSLDL